VLIDKERAEYEEKLLALSIELKETESRLTAELQEIRKLCFVVIIKP